MLGKRQGDSRLAREKVDAMHARRVLFTVLPAVLGLGLAGVGAAAPAGAMPVPGGFTCTGNFSNYPNNAEVIPAGTYSSLTLPPGSACGIAGQVVVNGPVTLGRASGLGLVSGGSLRVNGPVTVGYDAAFGPLGVIAPINVNGPLFVGPNGFVVLDSGGVSGPVLAAAPSGLELYSIHVGGSVQILGGGGQNPVEQEIGNPYYRFIDVEGDVIAGPVTDRLRGDRFLLRVRGRLHREPDRSHDADRQHRGPDRRRGQRHPRTRHLLRQQPASAELGIEHGDRTHLGFTGSAVLRLRRNRRVI